MDRLSVYGYRRPTTPNLDRLLASGARFAEARTVEPLTNPALCSLFTSAYPHEHGATRNGLRLRPDMPSLARMLGRRGFRTAGFVGNWTLRNRISGLGDHFQSYEEVFTRKRWLGMFKGEATAEDLTDSALAWLDEHRADHRRPFLLWVHYVEPHAPYRLHEDLAGRLGIPLKGDVGREDRYDTEVAFADREAGRLLARVEGDPALAASTLVVFAADHGESLGEHGDWGHGRTLYEPALRIPLGFAWPGRLRPQVVGGQAVILDVAPTVLGLLGLPAPSGFRGFDWTPVLQGKAPPPQRATWYQAHKGAVLSSKEGSHARRRGLLEIARIEGDRKEVYRPGEKMLRIFDLARDPGEARDISGIVAGTPAGKVAGKARAAGIPGPGRTGAPGPLPSPGLREWLASVNLGLAASDRLAPPDLDAESLARLRALGYAE